MKNEYIDSNKKIGVLISNLGTPDSPSRKDLKKYLNQFLMDKRLLIFQDCCGFLFKNNYTKY